jgi:hypothetical protein
VRLIRDEQAYFRTLSDFVEQRVSAAAFMTRFRHLWECDGAEGVDSVVAMSGAPHNQASLYGVLDSINTLCETFARNLPSGCGYRVSEEQFRKEVQSLVSTLLLASPRRS